MKGSEELDAPFEIISIGPPAAAALELAHLAMGLAPSCESPIEVDLGAHILRLLPAQFQLKPQFRIARFRFDFAVMFDGHALVLIECDGRDFHCTDAQIANDRRKDVAAARAGIKVLRFTGSQIFRYPAWCARHVLEHLGT